MTIDSTWIASFKEEAPHAFTPRIPFSPKAAFCDGQIRLMRGHCGEDDFLTWDGYIYQQFQRHVQRFYDDHGVATVILAFDDYAHVPEAKCMTQVKRRKHLPKLEILEREPLPTVCPSGEKWAQCIANRVFKSKVIALVIQTLPKLLDLAGRTLIIDYAGPPVEFTVQDGHLQSRRMDTLLPLGEADVKFTRYADLYRELLVDSVDGDSVPIALLHHEAAVRDLTGGSMRREDLSGAPPSVCIYRISTRVSDDSPGKRKRREFEYVNIPALYGSLRDAVLQCTGRMASPTHGAHCMGMLLALIGLTGTDYTRNLPQVSGKTVFNLLPDLWLPLMRSYSPATGQMDVALAADHVVARVYASKYATHVKSGPATLSGVLDALQASKLSQRTRDALPTAARVACTVRNVNWLIRYWREPGLTPDPLETEGGVATFGFVKRGGVVGYVA